MIELGQHEQALIKANVASKYIDKTSIVIYMEMLKALLCMPHLCGHMDTVQVSAKARHDGHPWSWRHRQLWLLEIELRSSETAGKHSLTTEL